VSLPRPRRNGLEPGAALEVGAADAKLFDNVARGSGARDGRSQLRDLRVHREFVVRLMGRGDSDVDDAV
jgi:hypothetical protein